MRNQHERQQRFDALLPILPKETLKYQSLSEYACSQMLLKYTDWKGVQGLTFQIKVGKCTFDFLVGNTLVEYHPISLKREFNTRGLRDILSAMHRLTRPERVVILKALAEELGSQYDKRRKQVAAASPTHSNYDVLCVFDQEQFVEKVLTRFATRPLPPMDRLKMEFRKLQKEAAAQKLVG